MDSTYDIRVPRDQRLFDSFPGLFAAFHALHRLLAPRHPPHALSNLTTMILVSIEQNQPSPVARIQLKPLFQAAFIAILPSDLAAKHAASHLATPDDIRTAKHLRVY
jgi:hypothetical protein